MEKKLCPSCDTNNNPSFTVCWHCKQRLDAETPLIKKKAAYDAFKLAEFSNVFNRENVKLAILFIPWFILWQIMESVAGLIFPSQKGLKLIVLFGLGTVAFGWVVKNLLLKYSKVKLRIPDNIFMTGLKIEIYSILPTLILSIKLLFVYIPAYYILNAAPSFNSNFVSFLSGVLRFILVIFQSAVAATVYAIVIRYLYEERDNSQNGQVLL